MSVALLDATSGVASVTHTGGTSSARIVANRSTSIEVLNGASNVVTYTVEGSNDRSHWTPIYYGKGSAGAYTQAAGTTIAAAYDVLSLPPDDLSSFVRVNVSVANANGTTFRVVGSPL